MKTAYEIAEWLAEKAALEWSYNSESPISLNSIILQSIPLRELLEVARAADADRGVVTALAELKKKLPEL